jgi:hypothetical protein
LSSREAEIDRELDQFRASIYKIGTHILVALMECPKVHNAVKVTGTHSGIDEVVNLICVECKEETTCSYCRREHELKNYVWNQVINILSQGF